MEARRLPDNENPKASFAGLEQSARLLLSMTPERLKQLVIQLSEDERRSLKDQLQFLIEQPTKIENFFLVNVGYPTLEAAKKGIQAYADGTVRKLEIQLTQLSQEFSTKLSLFKSEPVKQKIPEQVRKEREEAEKMLCTLEAFARHYSVMQELHSSAMDKLAEVTAAIAESDDLRSSSIKPGKR